MPSHGTGARSSIKPMTNIQVRAAVKAQKQSERQAKLVYRGVAYIKGQPTRG